ncbi:hypothetical protein P691DRAFT_807216 [Macrolepiota fuliginosa MF-IS2]|uniref:Uncharacterized protein n=1 Tax=Macrolepiota fuliginosa MF-IS2 TaxID=1400762 RepID=A0A9P6C0E6_9AGAR|nr:hypothetical protein P691DRAFT_807216 [Macrolepiota fuliginosa MF-IS2]
MGGTYYAILLSAEQFEMDGVTIPDNVGDDGGHYNRSSWDTILGAMDGPSGASHFLAPQRGRDLASPVDPWQGQSPLFAQPDQLQLQPTPQPETSLQQFNYVDRRPQVPWSSNFQHQSQSTGLFPPQRALGSYVQPPGPSALTLHDYANRSPHQNPSFVTSSTFFALIITQAAFDNSSAGSPFSPPGAYRAIRGDSIPQPDGDNFIDRQYILTAVQGSVVNGIVHDEDTYVAFAFAPPPSGSGCLEEAECRMFLLRRIQSSRPLGGRKGKQKEYIEPLYAISRIDHPIQPCNRGGENRGQGTQGRGRPRTARDRDDARRKEEGKRNIPPQELEQKIRAAFSKSFKDLAMSMNESTVVTDGVGQNDKVGFGDAGPSGSMGRAAGLGACPDSVGDGVGGVGNRVGRDSFTPDIGQAQQHQDNLEAFLQSNGVGVGEDATGGTQTMYHLQSVNGGLNAPFHPVRSFPYASVNEGVSSLDPGITPPINVTIPPAITHAGISSNQTYLPAYGNLRENASYEDLRWPWASSTATNTGVHENTQLQGLIHNSLEAPNTGEPTQGVISTAFPTPATRTQTLRGASRTQPARGQRPYPSFTERQLQPTPTRARMGVRGESSSQNPRLLTPLPPTPLLAQPFTTNTSSNTLHKPAPSFATGHYTGPEAGTSVDHGNLHCYPTNAHPLCRAHESSPQQLEFQGFPEANYARR